jgi:O-acetyl-ADP-ribose deacetylase (regulator of RNase III)
VITITMGGIAQQKVEAVVYVRPSTMGNATLLSGGDADGAIHRAAGPQLKAECGDLDGYKPGEVKVTSGYGIAAGWIIHTVPPEVGTPLPTAEQQHQLGLCYYNTLQQALQYGLRTIAFPCIGTGRCTHIHSTHMHLFSMH